MSEHTPGPWEYRKVTIGHPDNAKNPIVSAPDNYIARLFSAKSTLLGLSSRAPFADVAEANARLIAAAPDLLEACELVCQYAPFHTSDCQGVVVYEEEEGVIFEDMKGCTCFLSSIKAAITKARGQS